MNKLFGFAEESNIVIEYCRLLKNGSMSIQGDDGDFVLMDYSLIESGANEKVHLAHELGHCATGSFYNPYTTLNNRKKHENKADKWAIEQLISAEALDAAVADGHTEIYDLAEYFGVTEDFMRKAVCWYTKGNLAVELYF